MPTFEQLVEVAAVQLTSSRLAEQGLIADIPITKTTKVYMVRSENDMLSDEGWITVDEAKRMNARDRRMHGTVMNRYFRDKESGERYIDELLGGMGAPPEPGPPGMGAPGPTDLGAGLPPPPPPDIPEEPGPVPGPEAGPQSAILSEPPGLPAVEEPDLGPPPGEDEEELEPLGDEEEDEIEFVVPRRVRLTRKKESLEEQAWPQWTAAGQQVGNIVQDPVIGAQQQQQQRQAVQGQMTRCPGCGSNAVYPNAQGRCPRCGYQLVQPGMAQAGMGQPAMAQPGAMGASLEGPESIDEAHEQREMQCPECGEVWVADLMREEDGRLYYRGGESYCPTCRARGEEIGPHPRSFATGRRTRPESETTEDGVIEALLDGEATVDEALDQLVEIDEAKIIWLDMSGYDFDIALEEGEDAENLKRVLEGDYRTSQLGTDGRTLWGNISSANEERAVQVLTRAAARAGMDLTENENLFLEKCPPTGKAGARAKRAAARSYSKEEEPEAFFGTAHKVAKAIRRKHGGRE